MDASYADPLMPSDPIYILSRPYKLVIAAPITHILECYSLVMPNILFCVPVSFWLGSVNPPPIKTNLLSAVLN